jgi:hypothetical protein
MRARFSCAGRRAGLFAVVALALVCPACARSDRKPVYPVHGQVLYEGRPVPGAQVILHPLTDDDKEHPLRPTGQVADDGTFQLTTYTAADGAPEGSYAVTVSLLKKPANVEGDFARNVLPARYEKPQSSPLKVEITRGSNELQPLQMSRR